MSERTVRIGPATCTHCGCLCDDIGLMVDLDRRRITEAENACDLGRAWFADQTVEERPAALIDGEEASVTEAADEAARILVEARFPVIYCSADTTCEAQRRAVALANMLKANLDTGTSVRHGPYRIAFPRAGVSTATLGEVRNRADLVIYWGSDPVQSHPRHLTRYTAAPAGTFVPGGREGRTLVVLDVRATRSAEEADIFIELEPGSDFELIWALRALVGDRPIDPSVESRTGVTLATMTDLVRRMKGCRYGAIFFGTGLTRTRGRHFNSGALLALTIDLNQHTHFVALPLGGGGNDAGADNVLAWQTGFPFAVNFSRGYPRFDPGEFTAVGLLARGEADAACIIGSDPASDFPAESVERLGRIPVVSLGPKPTRTSQLARVSFTTAPFGIGTAGTVYRVDDVSIRLRPALASPQPDDEEILAAIHGRVRERLEGRR